MKVLLGLTLMLVIYGSLTPTGMRFLPWYQPNLTHVLAYAFIAFLMVCSCRVLRGGFWIAGMVACLLGLAIEMIQYFIPAREARLDDMLFNLLGVLIGGILALVLSERNRRMRMIQFPRMLGLVREDGEQQ